MTLTRQLFSALVIMSELLGICRTVEHRMRKEIIIPHQQLVGDSIAVSKRRLTQILDESIPEQGGGAQADENWGVLAGIVTSIRTPTDKVTFLNIAFPRKKRL